MFPSWPMVLTLCQALGVKCDAFLESPASGLPPSKAGRPRKTIAGDVEASDQADVEKPAAKSAKKPRKKK